MPRVSNFNLTHYNVIQARWVAANLIGLGLLLPFRRVGESGTLRWLAYYDGAFDPILMLIFLWPLTAAYCAARFAGLVPTLIRVIAELRLLPVLAWAWIIWAFAFAFPAVGAAASGIGILLYFATVVVDIGKRAHGIARRFR